MNDLWGENYFLYCMRRILTQGPRADVGGKTVTTAPVKNDNDYNEDAGSAV